MRKIAVRNILVSSLLIGLFATGISAQEIPWGPGGGYPGFSGMAPPPPMKCKPMNPAPCPSAPPMCGPQMPPAFYPCPPPGCQTTSSEPSVYLGYLFKDHGAGLQIQFNNGDVASINSTRNDFDLQGVWLELAVPVFLSPQAGLVFTGSHLFPVQPNAVQTYSRISGAARRQWTPDIQWWELNAAALYRFSQMTAGIAGFRWSSFVVDFNNPTNQLGFTNSADQAKLTTNAYIPFVGVLIERQLDCCSKTRCAVIGFPTLPSDVDFTETLSLSGQQVSTTISPKGTLKSGYFFEASSEYSTQVRNWSYGAFVRFTALHSERSHDVNVSGGTRQVDVTFDRMNWIVGGKIGVAF
jgi:hypothetical protein